MHCTLIFVRKTLANFTAHLQSSKTHRYNLIFPKLFYNNPATPEKERWISGKVRNGRSTPSVALDGRVVPLLGAGQGRLLWTSTVLFQKPKSCLNQSSKAAWSLHHDSNTPKFPKPTPGKKQQCYFHSYFLCSIREWIRAERFFTLLPPSDRCLAELFPVHLSGAENLTKYL